MKKISIKNVVTFRGKSEKNKKIFVTNLMIDKTKVDTDSGGGDYWVTSLSAISNSFKLNNLNSIINKRDELEEKYGETKIKKTKTMYKRNIDVLYNYENFDLKKWMPSETITFLKKDKSDFILSRNELQLEAIPKYVFMFQRNGVKEIGAIWFIAKLNGFKNEELGMFADILYQYLHTHFSKDYNLNPKYCIAVDVFNKIDINYSQLEKGEIPFLLNSTLDEIKNLLKIN